MLTLNDEACRKTTVPTTCPQANEANTMLMVAPSQPHIDDKVLNQDAGLRIIMTHCESLISSAYSRKDGAADH